MIATAAPAAAPAVPAAATILAESDLYRAVVSPDGRVIRLESRWNDTWGVRALVKGGEPAEALRQARLWVYGREGA